MTKKLIVLLTFFILISNIQIRADEGMWLLSLLKKYNIADMKKKGFKLEAEDIYSINKSCLKDAVVALGDVKYDFSFSCSAEVISKEGLLLTNHHCGYDEIQQHSLVEHNYLKDGFWAMKKTEELANPGKTASFLIRMEDVTEKVLKSVTEDMDANQREEAIKKVISEISEKATEGTHYKAKVSPFFYGNQYFLMVYETFLDVRLVGAPPSAIGKFGGDTDNWMWPRHTGDFSLFRVYTAADGSPAEYSEDNVPLKAKYHFPISLKGVKEGDFAMVMGYPGTTERYITSWGVKEIMQLTNKSRIDVRTEKLRIMKEEMNKNEETYIKYASKYSTSSNYWKYSIGQNKGLRKLNVVEKKQNIEKQLKEWINAKSERKEKYGEIIGILQENIIKNQKNKKALQYLSEALLEGPEFTNIGYELYPYFEAVSKRENVMETKSKLKEKAEEFFKNYDAETDKKLLINLLKIYEKNVEPENQTTVIKFVEQLFGGDYEVFADFIFSNSVTSSKQRLYDLLDKTDMTPLVENSKIIDFANKCHDAIPEWEQNEDAEKDIIVSIQKQAIDHFADFDVNKQQKILEDELIKITQEVEANKRPEIFETINKDFGGNIGKFVKKIMKKSIFANKKKMDKFVKSPDFKVLREDLVTQIISSIRPFFVTEIIKNDVGFNTSIFILQKYFELSGNLDESKTETAQRLFMQALMEMKKDKNFYPDANSTMRLTYGVVGGYKAADAVKYKYYTTMRGIMEKEDNDNRDFNVPEKLKELYKKKDFGIYATKDKQMNVCFITNNDITGGNSGSPVINGNGELIGTAFDGNWEAMSGDIAFEPELQKTICVDIRYILFIIDKFAGAKNLINEMTIIK